MTSPDTSALPGTDAPHRYWQVPAPDPERRLLAGVAAGSARELGLEPIWVRLGFIVLLAAGGWGAMLYLMAWGVMVTVAYRVPRNGMASAPVPKGRTGGQRLAGFWCVVAGLFLFFERMVGLPTMVMVPLALLVGGALVSLERLAVNPSESSIRSIGRRRLDRSLVSSGIVAAIVAVPLLVRSVHRWTGAGYGVAVGVGFGLGLVALSAPWWWRILTELDAERQARVRADERADVAAHLHDSVLQTLTLIQQSDDPVRMVGLARRQERELRNWLDPDRVDRTGGGLRGRLDEVIGEVEQRYAVSVDVVAVGDCVVDDRVDSLLSATREAIINAAKHSGIDQVDCYVEVMSDRIEVFVRDRGRGFDPSSVPGDRRGVSDSIERRMLRLGGSVRIDSELGHGTDVELVLPRSDRVNETNHRQKRADR